MVISIMQKNVEIKAKIRDFNKIISTARSLCGTEAKVLNQTDTFFNTSQGRLKLRNFQDGSKSQLIFYSRPDIEGPKVSNYSISYIEDSKNLLNVLQSALGIVGTVKKSRYLFLYEQTRIHIDKVEGLGEFVELEVVLSPSQSIEEGERIASFLMKELEISEEDLIKSAYIDYLKTD